MFKPRDESSLWLLITGGMSKPPCVLLSFLVVKPRDESSLWGLPPLPPKKSHLHFSLPVEKCLGRTGVLFMDFISYVPQVWALIMSFPEYSAKMVFF